MPRWIERRKRHERMAARFLPVWDWPYSPWFFLWLALFFGQFFLRLAMIWGVIHGNYASPSYSTLPESIALQSACERLSALDPVALANGAAARGDFRLAFLNELGFERRTGRFWCLPWPIRCDHNPVTDIHYAKLEGRLCDSHFYVTDPDFRRTKNSQPHYLEDNSALCSFTTDIDLSRYILEERGYNGDGPYIPREAVAFYVRVTSFLSAYNATLAQHPDAPVQFHAKWFWWTPMDDINWELYKDYLHHRVPEHLFQEWVDWDER